MQLHTTILLKLHEVKITKDALYFLVTLYFFVSSCSRAGAVFTSREGSENAGICSQIAPILLYSTTVGLVHSLSYHHQQQYVYYVY